MFRATALIGGQPFTSTSAIDVIDPSVGEAFADAPDCTAADVAHTVANAQAAAPIWRKRNVTDCAAMLRKIGCLVLRDRSSLADTESRQTG